jgi:hypothetical protein
MPQTNYLECFFFKIEKNKKSLTNKINIVLLSLLAVVQDHIEIQACGVKLSLLLNLKTYCHTNKYDAIT